MTGEARSAAHTPLRLLATAAANLEAENARLHDALQRIVDFPINEKAAGAWHFAEVRQIAREALKDVG